MTTLVLDDHLLRDLLADDLAPSLAGALEGRRPATTNLYLFRLSRSLVAARGGRLTGRWPHAQRLALARALLASAGDVDIVPLRSLAFRMAELADAHQLSALAAEAVAAAEHLDSPICVWSGDVGSRMQAAADAVGVDYVIVDR